MKRLLLFSAVLGLITGGVSSRAGAEGEAVKMEIHGFASTTGYYQSTQSFLQNGQGYLIASNTDQTPVFGFDVRQSRLNFLATGPQVLKGATPKVFLEIDFFGSNGAGSYGEVSVFPRLRLAYAEMERGPNVVRVGQDWELLRVNHPVTLSHIAFPFWGSGVIGWREPGVSLFHSRDWRTSKFEFGGQIIKSDWQNPLPPGAVPPNENSVSAGQLSARPGLEARVKWMRESVSAYVVGHWNRVSGTSKNALVNLPANAVAGTNPTRNFDVLAFKLGAKAKISRFSLLGELYTGKNMGPLQGNILQFPFDYDVHEMGGWAQVGYDMTEKWTAYLLYSTAQPNHTDAQAANFQGGEPTIAVMPELRLSSSVTGLLVQYTEGAFSAGPEVFVTHTAFSTNGGATNRQITLTANYNF